MVYQLIAPDDLAAIEAVDRIESDHPSREQLELHHEEFGIDARLAVAPKPIKSNCSRDFYPALRSSGRRPLSEIWWVVEHAQESLTALSAASWFRNPDAKGSAHLCVDGAICYRTLPNDAIPWGAPGANYHGFHIEQAGYTRWSRTDWASRELELQRSAFKTAWHLHLFGLPPIFRMAADLERGRKGVTTHLECTRAFGGDHTDPGSGWPRDRFMGLVKTFYAKL
jgi:hypothetical protein